MIGTKKQDVRPSSSVRGCRSAGEYSAFVQGSTSSSSSSATYTSTRIQLCLNMNCTAVCSFDLVCMSSSKTPVLRGHRMDVLVPVLFLLFYVMSLSTLTGCCAVFNSRRLVLGPTGGHLPSKIVLLKPLLVCSSLPVLGQGGSCSRNGHPGRCMYVCVSGQPRDCTGFQGRFFQIGRTDDRVFRALLEIFQAGHCHRHLASFVRR
mmetsp:Transcript_41518/g.118738  ORF Transcript_41518/g.118738 Transcript_41518/m.118738 type:complete len:205 (+) Transcript_41518:1295-1909(+)